MKCWHCHKETGEAVLCDKCMDDLKEGKIEHYYETYGVVFREVKK